MKIALLKIRYELIVTMILLSSPLSAAELIASTSLSMRSAESSEPGSGYKEGGWSVSQSLSKKVDSWNFGGVLSYSLSSLDQPANASHKKPEGTSAVAMVSRDINPRLTFSATLGYGYSAANTSEISGGTVVTYTSGSDFLSSSIGLSQSFALSRRSMAILSARYTHIISNQKSYGTSVGANVPGSKSIFGFTTFGLGYSHRFGRYTPYAQLDWNLSDRSFIANDKDYGTLSFGGNYRKNSTTNIGLSISSVLSKAHSRDDTIGVSLSHAF